MDLFALLALSPPSSESESYLSPSDTPTAAAMDQADESPSGRAGDRSAAPPSPMPTADLAQRAHSAFDQAASGGMEDPLAFAIPPFLWQGVLGDPFAQPHGSYRYDPYAYSYVDGGADTAGASKPSQTQTALPPIPNLKAHAVGASLSLGGHTAASPTDPHAQQSALPMAPAHVSSSAAGYAFPADLFGPGSASGSSAHSSSTQTQTYAPPPGPPPPPQPSHSHHSHAHAQPHLHPHAHTDTLPPPPQPPSPPLPPARTRDENGVPFYTSTGFDMLSILAQVVNRPSPSIDLGAVDLSCAFCVVDVRERDQPIVYASPMFLLLTGYAEGEVVGKNCRFLQAPDGEVAEGQERKWTGAKEVYAMKHHLRKGREVQVELVNYRKGGQRFLNLVTVVPVPDPKTKESEAFLVGFQVDLSEGPSAAMSKLRDGSYLGDYHTMGLPPALLGRGDTYAISRELPQVLGTGADVAATQAKINALLLENNSDFIHVVSLKGAYLYVSPSISRALGHDAASLIGSSLLDLVHPADRVPLERELKDAGVAQAGTVRLLYRMRVASTAHTLTAAFASAASAPEPQYAWVESAGRLHLEAGKGRKAIVLCARRVRVPPRPHGGVGGLRAWAVLDAHGAVLAAAPAGALPPAGAHFADAAAPPEEGLLRRVIAQGAQSAIGALTVGMRPEYGGGRRKVVLSAREGRLLAEVRDEGPDPPGAAGGVQGGMLDEMGEEHAQSWQFALNHLKQQNAALRERLEAARQRAAPASALGKRPYE